MDNCIICNKKTKLFNKNKTILYYCSSCRISKMASTICKYLEYDKNNIFILSFNPGNFTFRKNIIWLSKVLSSHDIIDHFYFIEKVFDKDFIVKTTCIYDFELNINLEKNINVIINLFKLVNHSQSKYLQDFLILS